jgi:hypothetical protein
VRGVHTFGIPEVNNIMARMGCAIVADVLDVRATEGVGGERVASGGCGTYRAVLGLKTLHMGHIFVAWSIEPYA